MAVDYQRLPVNSIGGINTELTKIQTALQDSLSRTNAQTNFMDTDLDMNNERILNLPEPVSDTEPARVKDVQDIASAAKGSAVVIYSTDPVPAASLYPEGTKLIIVDLAEEYTQVEGAWVEDGTVGDDVSVTAASYMTLAEAQASDLKVGQYVRLTDFSNGLYKVVDYTDTGGYYINLETNKLKLQYGDVINFDWVDILDTDTPAEVTAKLNAVAALVTDGMTLNVSGDYTLNGPVTFPHKNIKLLLNNSKFTQLMEYTRTFDLQDVGASKINGGVFYGVGTEHDGGATVWNNVAAIYLNSPEGATLSGVRAYNHAGGSFRYKDANGLRFIRCEAEGIGSLGGIQPLDNNGDFAIGSFNSTSDNKVKVHMCDLSGHCFGIGASRGESLQVTSTEIYDIAGQHGVYASAMSKTLIKDSNFANIAGEGVKVQIATDNTNVRSVVVKDNNFTDIGGSPIVIGRTTNVGNSYVYSVNIDGNIIRNVGTYFINLRDCYGIIGDNNDMQGNTGGYGLYLDGFGGRVGKSTIADTNWSGIWLEMLADVEVDLRLTDCCQGTTGSGLDISTYMYATVQSGEVGTPVLTISSGVFSNQRAIPVEVTTCIRTSSSIEVASKGFDNKIDKSWRFDNISQLETNISSGADFTGGATRDPSTPIYGRGRRVLYGTQDPASGGMTDRFIVGDVCYRSNYDGTGVYAWVCTSDGNPGTWVARS